MASTLGVAGVVTANAGVVVDEMTLDGDTLTATDDFIIDAVGEIVLDADNQGSANGVQLKDGGVHYGSLFRSDSDLRIKSIASDEDIVFMGNDGGAEITALTLDMSADGHATFKNGLTLTDGNLVVANGHGIDFSAAGNESGMSSELLDDYEEGAYDATVTCSGSGTITLHTGFNSASYTKVGNLVHVSGLLNVASVSSPVGIAIISLPFTSANLEERRADSAAVIYVTGVASNNIADFLATTNENTATLNLQLGDTVSPVNDSANQIQANTNMVFSITYRTA